MGGLDPRFGGPAVTPIETARGARRAGANNVVIFPAPRSRAPWLDDVFNTLSAEGTGVRVFSLSRFFAARSAAWGVSFDLARWLLMNVRRFDLVHAHGAWTFTSFVALLAAKVTGRPAVLSTHETLTNFDVSKSRPVGRLVKRALRLIYLAGFDLVIVSSELELRDTQRRGSRIAIVPHAVPARPTRMSSRPPSVAGSLRVGYLGRLDPKKNLGVLIEALGSLPHVSLEIGGTGSEILTRDLHALAARVGIVERMTWHGFIDLASKPAFFASVDVVVMPSKYECFGMAAAEAMCAGVPVVVSENTGVAPIVAKYCAGLVIEPTLAGLRGVLETLASDEALLETLARGAEAARAEFDVDRHGSALLGHYARLTTARSKPEVSLMEDLQ